MDFNSCNGKINKSYRGFAYRLDRTLKSGIKSFRCVNRDCKGRIHVEGDVTTVREQHNHVPDPAGMEVKHLQSEVRQRATTSHDTPRLIIQESQANLTDEAVAKMPQYKTLQRTVQQKRKVDGAPTLNPNNVAEIDITDTLKQTLRGDNFLLHDSGADDPQRFFIFGTAANIDILKANLHWFSDGTFKIAPRLFFQLTTIHVQMHNQVLPMLYIFLQRKTQVAYTRALREVYDLVGGITPLSIMCDFEKAFHGACRDVFGANIAITGCLFHLGQCIWRKIQALSLADTYVDDRDIRMKCKMLLALAFVPVQSITRAFEEISVDLPEELQGLYDYFEDTWIGRPTRNQRRQPTFTQAVWCVHERVQQHLPRTNNSVEAWHRAFQRTVGYVHPTVYKLIEALRLEQSNTENSVVRLQAGQRAPAANAACRQKELRLQTVVGSFSEERLSDYVRSVAHNCELSV